MRPTTTFFVPALSALLLMGCGGSTSEDKQDCEVVATVAQKCLSRAREQSIEDITKDCEAGLKDKEMWTWAAIDCYRAVGDDCGKWVECIQKDPYKKEAAEVQKEAPKKEEKKEEKKDEKAK